MSPKIVAGWFIALLLFAWLSREQVRGGRADRCSFDGAAVDRVHRVDLMVESSPGASFCSIACARAWPQRPAGTWWQVRDEVTGTAIDAARACFVLSRVVTVPARGERIHAFRHWTDAMDHCAQFGGARINDPLAAGAPR